MINNLFITGNSRSGKSTAVDIVRNWLDGQRLAGCYFSDRAMLEEVAKIDTVSGDTDSDGWTWGSKSKLRTVDGKLQVHILDGAILNEVHREMIRLAADLRRSEIYVFEYTTGQDIPFDGKTPLLQHGDHLVENLTNQGLGEVTCLWQLVAPFAERKRRNLMANDAMAAETFTAYFPDGGEISAVSLPQFGARFQKIENLGQSIYFEFTVKKLLDEQVGQLLMPEEGLDRRRL